MTRYENDCVDCGLPCLESCPYKNVKHLYCDKCKNEAEKLYVTIDGDELCFDCFMSEVEVIE